MELTRTQHRAPGPVFNLTVLTIYTSIAVGAEQITPALFAGSAAVVCGVAAGDEFRA